MVSVKRGFELCDFRGLKIAFLVNFCLLLFRPAYITPARLYWETAAPARLSPARIYLSTSPVPHNHICSEKMMFREIKVEQEEGEGREREGKKGE